MTGRWRTLVAEADTIACLEPWDEPNSRSAAKLARRMMVKSVRVSMDRGAYACMLGGPDRRTLFVLTAQTHEPEAVRAQRAGRVETVRVEVPGAGRP